MVGEIQMVKASVNIRKEYYIQCPKCETEHRLDGGIYVWKKIKCRKCEIEIELDWSKA